MVFTEKKKIKITASVALFTGTRFATYGSLIDLYFDSKKIFKDLMHEAFLGSFPVLTEGKTNEQTNKTFE